MLCDLYSGTYGRVTVRILLDASLSPTLRPYYDDFTAAYVQAARSIVQRGVSRGELPTRVDPASMLEQLFGATMLHVLFFSDPDHELSLPNASHFADRLIDNVLNGVLERPSP
jgi:hypothetical protein